MTTKRYAFDYAFDSFKGQHVENPVGGWVYYDDHNREFEVLFAKVTTLTTQNKSLEWVNDALNSDIEELEAKLTKANEELDKAYNDIAKLDNMCTCSEQRNTKLENDIKDHIAVNQALEINYKELIAAKTSLEAKLQALAPYKPSMASIYLLHYDVIKSGKTEPKSEFVHYNDIDHTLKRLAEDSCNTNLRVFALKQMAVDKKTETVYSIKLP
jgi:chromosome segregation ATPase